MMQRMIGKTLIPLLVFLTVFGLEAQVPVDNILKTRALRESGRNREAAEHAVNALKQYPDSRLFVEAAEAYISLNDFSSATACFSEASKLEEGSGDYGLARIYAMKGNAATSVYHLGLSMESPYKKKEKEVLLDNAFRQVENTPEWRQFWKRDWYSPAEQTIAEIEFYNSRGKFSESAVLVDGLRSKYGDRDVVSYADALVKAGSGSNQAAVKILSELLTGDPGNEKYLRLLADAQSGSSNPAGASVTYTSLIDKGAADAGLFLKRAECYRRTGEYDKALPDIEKYLSFYPENAAALSLAGKTEAAAGDNLRALEYFSENIRLHPSDAGAYVDRADAYLVAKSWEWAEKDYSMALDLSPENGYVYLNKGIALLNTGKKDDACIDFRKAFDSGNKKATEYISRHCIK